MPEGFVQIRINHKRYTHTGYKINEDEKCTHKSFKWNLLLLDK